MYDTICIIRLIWTCKLQNRNKFFCIKICMMQFLKHRTNSISSDLYEENQPIKMRVSHYSNIWRLNQKYRRINLKGTWLIVCSYHITYAFQSESTFYSCLNVKEFLARNRREIWSLSDCNWTQTHNHFARKQAFICTVHLALCSCHITYAFQNESTLCSCLNVKEFLAWNRREIFKVLKI